MANNARDAATILPPNYRWNAIALMGDWTSFGLAMTFVSASTVLPTLVDRLSGSPIAVGLISTLASGGWLLPQLFAAGRVSRLPCKKPAIILPSLVGRPMFILGALALFWLAESRPALVAAIILAGFGIFNVCDGIASVAWFDLFSRAIPPARRGRFIGITQVVSALLTTGVGGLVGYVLGDGSPLAYPANYASLFLAAAVFLALSLLFCANIRETPCQVDDAALTLRDYARELGAIWRGDANFRTISAIRLLLGLTSLSSPFYAVYAINEKGVPTGTIGLFLSAQIVGGFLYSILGGYLLERFGGRLTTRVEAFVALFAPALATIAGVFLPGHSPWFAGVYLLLFASLGALNSSFMLGHMNYLLEISPESKRPIYVGLSNTLTSVIIAFPLLGGALASAVSYEPLFALTVLGLLPALWLTARLVEPRKLAQSA